MTLTHPPMPMNASRISCGCARGGFWTPASNRLADHLMFISANGVFLPAFMWKEEGRRNAKMADRGRADRADRPLTAAFESWKPSRYGAPPSLLTWGIAASSTPSWDRDRKAPARTCWSRSRLLR